MSLSCRIKESLWQEYMLLPAPSHSTDWSRDTCQVSIQISGKFLPTQTVSIPVRRILGVGVSNWITPTGINSDTFKPRQKKDGVIYDAILRRWVFCIHFRKVTFFSSLQTDLMFCLFGVECPLHFCFDRYSTFSTSATYKNFYVKHLCQLRKCIKQADGNECTELHGLNATSDYTTSVFFTIYWHFLEKCKHVTNPEVS